MTTKRCLRLVWLLTFLAWLPVTTLVSQPTFAYDGHSTVAAKTGTQLEFGFVKNLENPNFVLYKSSEFNPSMLRPGEYTLNLPYLRNEALDWAQNQQALQRAMNIGNPIREANPNALGGWLQRERDFLGSGGWQRTQQGSDLFWVKPSGK